MNASPRIQWAPKVRRGKILKLYQTDALGLQDEDLVAEVGYDLLARCRSILMVTDARQVDCPSCQAEINCPAARWSRETPPVCPVCGWHATYGQWRELVASSRPDRGECGRGLSSLC